MRSQFFEANKAIRGKFKYVLQKGILNLLFFNIF